MREYRLYCLNEQGKITASHEITASSDEDAVAQAKAMELPARCELWDHGRMVAKLDAHVPPRR
jgi:hypothetical protein